MDERQEPRQAEIRSLMRAWDRAGLNRRDFLRMLAAGASLATITGVLAACGGNPTATVAPTTAPVAPTAAATAAAAQPTTAPAAPTTAPAAPTTAPAAPTTAPAAPTAAATAATTQPTAAPTTAAAQPTAAPAAGTVPSGPNAGLPTGGKFTTLEPVGKQGGRVVEGSFADAETMNPILSGDTTSARINALFGNGLLGINPDNLLPYADLAMMVPNQQNGGVSADGLTYTFKVRTGVKFHDGKVMTAKDIVFTYKSLMNPDTGTPRAGALNEIVQSVDQQGDDTVIFKMKKVAANFLVTHAGYVIAPEHILGPVAPADMKTHPFSTGTKGVTMGTGPFKFERWDRGNQILVVKNPDYFRGASALDEYILKIIKDTTVSVAQLKTGEIDYGPINEPLYEEMTKQANVTAYQYDTRNFTYYNYQLDPTKSTLFQDVKTRHALAHAINREALIRAIRFGIGVVATGTMPVISWAYNPDGITAKYPFDVNRANQLLDEAGWARGADGIRAKSGQRLAFTIWTNAGNTIREQYVTALQQQWRAVGADVTPRTEEWAALLSRFGTSFDWEVLLIGFQWSLDPDQSAMFQTSSYPRGFNRAKYSNPQVDALIDQGITTVDPERRKAIYTQMQNLVLTDLPVNILDFPKGLEGVNKKVKNLIPNAVGPTWNAHLWWVQ